MPTLLCLRLYKLHQVNANVSMTNSHGYFDQINSIIYNFCSFELLCTESRIRLAPVHSFLLGSLLDMYKQK